MKNTVTLYDFRESFRQVRPNNFSYEGLEVLFDGLTEIEENCDTEIEFDVIGLCCEFSEATPEEIQDNYSVALRDVYEGRYIPSALIREWLEENTLVMGETSSGSIVYQDF